MADILVLTAAVWLTEDLHGLPSAVVALLPMIVLLVPGLAVTDD